MRKNKIASSVFALILAILFVIGTVPAFAVSLDDEVEGPEDILWNLDFNAMSSMTDNLGSEEYTLNASESVLMTEKDGQKVLGITNASGTYFIEDTNNVLKNYKAFYIEADMYFDAFPVGVGNDNGKSSHDYPMSFMTWITESATGGPQYGSIRVDDEGYLCTSGAPDKHLSETAKLPLGEWFNIRFIMNPGNKQCEVFINHESVGNYGFAMTSKDNIAKSRVRFFDTRYKYSVYFKGLSVTSDSSYRIGGKTEPSADYIGYQTTPIENGKFDLRLVAGLDTLDYNKTGFTVERVYKAVDEVIAEEDVVSSSIVYESINEKKGSAKVSAADLGCQYLTAIELKDIDTTNGDTEIVIRPWILKNGLRRYGKPISLMYTGESKDGYPALSPLSTATEYTLTVSDDTYVGGRNLSYTDVSPHGKEEVLDIKNNGNNYNSNYTRASFFKFNLPDAALDIIADAEAVYLEVTGKSVPGAGTNGIIAILSGVDTMWDEETLTKDIANTKAKIIEKIGERAYFGGASRMDVTDYIKKMIKTGETEVAFRMENRDPESVVGNNEFTLYSKEYQGGASAPQLVIVPSSIQLNYEVSLSKLNNDGYEPWGYAEKLVDGWFNGGMREEVYGETYGDLNLARVNNNSKNGDYSVYNPIVNSTANQYVRTLDTLSGYTQTTKTEYDEYYGITNLGVKGKATGFFHVEKIDGKFYIIDPVGNPFFAVGANTVELGATSNQKNASLAKYGSEAGFYEDLSAELHDDFGINTVTGSSKFGENGMVYIAGPGCTIGSYMGRYALSVSKGGSSAYLYNNTMNVFDPDFVSDAIKGAMGTASKYKDDDYLLGYTTDNELPGGDDILVRYLTIDYTEPVNAFSYATAWTYLKEATGNPNPSLEDANGDILKEFLGFVYGTYFKVLSNAIHAADPNHMYIGTRCNHPKEEGYLRALGAYCDLMTVNLYGQQNYSNINETIEIMYKYTGLPFLVTEFGMRAKESYDMNGNKLGNYSETATWLFETQQQRANSYESYTLNLLESNNCVGWLLYRFRDNDQTIYGDMNDGTKFYVASQSNQGTISKFTEINTGVQVNATSFEYYVYYQGETDSSNLTHNKGIYDNHMEQYPEMRDSFWKISENLVDLIHFFNK